MTLLNGLLAFGALAFTIPLAIHLLFRSRFTTLDWGAMHLLDSVIRVNRKRLQITNILLLLMRCMLPVLLAFCLARPLMTGFQAMPGDAPQSVVLAIDDSRSMSARDVSGKTRIEQAQEALTDLVGKLTRRDEVIVIRSSDVDAPAGLMGPQDALSKIRQLEANSAPVDLGRMLRAAVDAVADASHSQRRVIVVSDFQSRNVSNAALESLTKLSTVLAERNPQPIISFLNLGKDSDQLSNVSVEAIEIDAPAVVAGRGARFSARIRNSSDTPARDVRVVWSVDGKPLDPRLISIDARATATTRTGHRFEEPGVHEVSVAVEFTDALTADNRRQLGVDVIREIDVLLVDGKPSRKPLEAATDFLAIALSPYAFGGDDQPDAVRTTVILEGRIVKQLSDGTPDIIVLANVANVSNDAKKKIADFVLAGGSLVIFDGDLVKVDNYNEPWIGGSGELRLPARLGEFIGETNSREATPQPTGEMNVQYTPWASLISKDQRLLDQVDIFGYRRLSIPDVDEDESEKLPPSVALLSMASADPLVLTARRGQGKVVQFAISCDDAWSTLPLRRIYLPMMQQLVLDLAGTRKQATLEVGESFSVPTTEFTVDRSPESDQKPTETKSPPTYTIQVPAAAEVAIEPVGDPPGEFSWAETSLPGTYRIRQMIHPKQGEPIVTQVLRVVEVPAVESELRDTEPARLATAAASVDANLYTDIGTLQSDDRTRRFGHEVWRWLLIALLVLMVGELWLQQRMVKRLRTAESA